MHAFAPLHTFNTTPPPSPLHLSPYSYSPPHAPLLLIVSAASLCVITTHFPQTIHAFPMRHSPFLFSLSLSLSLSPDATRPTMHAPNVPPYLALHVPENSLYRSSLFISYCFPYSAPDDHPSPPLQIPTTIPARGTPPPTAPQKIPKKCQTQQSDVSKEQKKQTKKQRTNKMADSSSSSPNFTTPHVFVPPSLFLNLGFVARPPFSGNEGAGGGQNKNEWRKWGSSTTWRATRTCALTQKKQQKQHTCGQM